MGFYFAGFFALFSCTMEFLARKDSRPKGRCWDRFGQFCTYTNVISFVQWIYLYERGLEEPELFVFVAVELFSTSKNIQLDQKHVCPQVIFPGPQQKLGEKLPAVRWQLSRLLYQAELKFTLTEFRLNK